MKLSQKDITRIRKELELKKYYSRIIDVITLDLSNCMKIKRKYSRQAIADRFGVSKAYIQQIAENEN